MADLLHKLDKPPREARGFLWADYAELRCLTSEDGLYGEGHLVDLQTESEELHLDQDDDYGEDDLFEKLDARDDGEDVEREIDDVDEGGTYLRLAEAVSRKWADISRRLNVRQLSMLEYWPFEFRDGILISIFDADNKKHCLYVALLIASALRYCAKDRQGEVAASLEEIGYHLFRSIMPVGWHVKPFGAHQNIADGYQGKFAAKLEALGKDICAKFVAPASDFDLRDTGDGGLDVVAWHPLGNDSRGYIPVAYAQCGCSPGDWEHKQFEASPVAMELKIVPHHQASNFYILPHDLKSMSGGWERGGHLGRVIIIDRLRIIQLAKQYELVDVLPVWPFINEAASLRFAV